MKTLLMVLCLAVATSLQAQFPGAAPAGDVKVKVRFQEKKVSGKRICVVFLKNEGMKDLDKVNAEITLHGRVDAEKQSQTITVSVPKNQEKTFEVELKEQVPDPLDKTGFGATRPGIQKVEWAETVIASQAFRS